MRVMSFCRLLAVCLLMVHAAAPAIALAQGSAKSLEPLDGRLDGLSGGTLVVMGGAIKEGNDAVWQAVVTAAGGPGSLIIVLPTASADPERAGQLTAEQLQRRGARTQVLPIAPRWPGSSLQAARQAALEPRWAQAVASAQGVFFTGGEQERLLDTLRPGDQDSPLMKSIRDLWTRGGVVAGTSAGAAVMGQVAIRGLDDPFEALLRPLHTGEWGAGFGLAPAHVVTDQHFLKRGRAPRLARLLLQSGRSLGLGVDEDSAAILRGGQALAVGARGLLFIDSTQAQVSLEAPAGPHASPDTALRVDGLRLSYVDRGDRFDLHARRVLTPAWRTPLPAGREAGRPAFFGDILLEHAIVNAMAQAAEGDGRRARGLAWQPERVLAFEWTLTRDEQTRAWGGPTRDDHTFEGVRLDIRPVKMAHPVYQDMDSLPPGRAPKTPPPAPQGSGAPRAPGG